MDEKSYWLAFSAFPGIGPLKFKLILKHFGSAKSAWKAPKNDIEFLFGEKLAEKLESFRKNFSIESYERIILKQGVSFLTWEDKSYPRLLIEISNPPFVLYVKGNLDFNKIQRTIAVVGTRRTTQYGRDVTKIFTQELVSSGFTVISGLAIGVDAISHKTTLDENGKTVAVLGCGVDCCSPEENIRLYDDIIKTGGAVISELPLGHPPTKGSFPSRNRIVAGLSQGVLVTEGAEDSGALITADYALKFGRKVFAVPGPITSSLSKGPYRLISQGAKLVTSVKDILKEFKIQNAKFKIVAQNSNFGMTTREEGKILEILGVEPLSFDEIVRRLKMDSSKAGRLLSMMELKGMIKSGGSTYSLSQ